MNIAMTSVFVNDPREAFAFYTGVLGFKERMYLPEMNLAIVVSPEDAGGTALLLEPNGNLGADTFQAGLYAAGVPAIVFGTADIHAEYARLQGRGVVFRQEPITTDHGTIATFEDTCGNLIQLFQS